MTYSQAIQFLYDLQLFGAKFGLENTLRLAALAGHPQKNLRFIHVAGTNGKGSVCAMLESVYRTAGLRVGLYTSPHLVSFAERIQVNRQLISEADVTRLVGEAQGWLGHFSKDDHPTFFEVVTVMALKYFAEQKCDLIIWETGMGGRLDATNIVTPLASVITNIQFDHQQWLGDTLAKIAFEKAGIIKPGVPVITGTDAAEALEVISTTARKRKSPLTVVSEKDIAEASRFELPLLGHYQRINAAVALAVIRTLQPVLPVDSSAMACGLKQVQWPGRLQVIRRGNSTILLDGGHNPAGSATVAEALRTDFAGQYPALILGAMRDKDWPAMCRILAPLAAKIFLIPTGSERSADPQKLIAACCETNSTAPITVCQSLADALKQTAGEKFITITGSLYIVGEALELLQTGQPGGERGLNNWQSVSRH